MTLPAIEGGVSMKKPLFTADEYRQLGHQLKGFMEWTAPNTATVFHGLPGQIAFVPSPCVVS